MDKDEQIARLISELAKTTEAKAVYTGGKRIEVRHSQIYQELVRLGARKQIKKKYRAPK